MTTPASATRTCIGYGSIQPHDVPWDAQHLANWAIDPKRKNVRCRDCDREYRRARKAGKTFADPPPRPPEDLTIDQDLAEAAMTEVVPDEVAGQSHRYEPDPDLVRLWKVLVTSMKKGDPAPNVTFLGPKGSGKTAGAAYLAAQAKLPLTKVDAASMTDPEAWFGTREVVVEDGASKTKYVPSAMVEALQKAGVLFIDEFNRVDDEHRNVWLPLTDGTGRVTNPLTGEVLYRHPRCVIIMAGNRGLQYTGTSAIDPAFTSRALIVEFDYIDEEKEMQVAKDATGCDDDSAHVFVRFAGETRAKALSDGEFEPISTREVIQACRLTARGLDRDLAAKYAIINAASAEGGEQSVRAEMEAIWNGVRLTRAQVSGDGDPDPDTGSVAGWVCPDHGKVRVVPAGTSGKTGLPYDAFRACPELYCEKTEDKDPSGTPIASKNTASGDKVCAECGTVNPASRNTFCQSCGAVLS